MNIKHTLIPALAALLLLPSCNDSFLEIVPDDNVTVEEFMDTPAEAREMLNGAYKSLASGSFMGGQGWLMAELFADHINGDPNIMTNGDLLAHHTRTTDIFLGTTRTFMHDGGKVHGRANFMLDNLGNVAGLDDATRNLLTAEARFLRGVSHFELVRMFAQPYGYTADNSHNGISIYTRYTTEPSPQSTVGEVYAQVLEDLLAAEAALPSDNGGFADKWAAKGYLAKVYFQMNDFAKAYQYANEVIQSGRYSLDTDLKRRFSQEGSAEAVFQLVSNTVTDANGNSFFVNHGAYLAGRYRVGPTGAAEIYLSEEAFARATANGDLRGEAWVSKATSGLITCNKFETDLLKFFSVPLVHLSELKLIRAESAGELGQNLDVAVQDLNDLKTRAGIPTLQSGTGSVVIIREARAERAVELLLEGNRLHDLKRIATATARGLTKLPENNLLIRGAAWDCPGLVCQFPDNELSGNPGLQPNPSGGCN